MTTSARLLATLLVFVVVPAYATAESDSPNVVLVMADDLGWGDVGYNGAKVAKTPHLDAMAKQSLVFNRFYAQAPVCSPTRGSCLTGRHPFRYGIPTANAGHLLPDEITLAEALKTRGYATGHFGKWHLGTLTTKVVEANRGGPRGKKHFALPTDHGFDEFFSTESKVPTWDPMLVPKTFGPMQSKRYGWLPIEPDEGEHYRTHYWNGLEAMVNENLRGDDSRIVVDRALDFIERSAEAETPFLAVVWFHAPHLPVVAGERHRLLFRDRPLNEQLYFGCIAALDEQVGRIRGTLREVGVAENTMLWFTSDNGPERGTPGSAEPFRERKRSLYEGGVRVPGLLEWPARVTEGRTTDVPCVTSDYYPTVLDALDLEMPRQPPLDGVSLLPLVEGKTTERPRPIGFRSGTTSTWSANRFKLVRKGKSRQPELYDLLEDPGEQKNVAAEHPEVVSRMQAELRAWRESVDRSATGADYSE